MNRFLHAVKRNVIVGLMMVLVLGVSQRGWGQLLLNEDFNTGYTTASNLAGQNSWTKGGSGPDVTVQNALPITYSGYNGGGGGNYILMPAASSTTSRVYKGFTTTSAGTNTMYFSFLLNLSSTAATGDYFITLGDPTTGIAYFARVFAQTSGAGYNIGIAKAAATGTYGTTVLSFNQTYLIVVRFTFVSGATNDQAYIWVNPSLASEPSAGSPEATISSGSDPGLSGGNVGNFLWHNRSINNPVGKFDGVRVALGSTSAIAWTNLAAAVSSTNYYLKSGGSIATLADWGQNTDGTGANTLTSIGDANITWNIRNNASVTLGAAWTLGSGSKVIVGDGTNATNFTIPSGFAVTGTVDVAALATLSIANTNNPTLGTLAATSTVAYTATAPQTVPLASYGNLSVSTTGGNATAGGIITVASALTVASGSTFNLSTFTLVGASLTTSGTGTLQVGNVGSTPIPTGRSWSMSVAYNSASAQTVVDGTYTNLDISGGNRTIATGTINISGLYTPGAGILTPSATNTINFSSASSQTIPAAAYNSITNTGNGVRTLASTGSIDIAGAFTPGTGNYTIGTSTINFNGSTAQSIPVVPVASGPNYYNITYSGSNTGTISNNLTVGNNCNISTGTLAITDAGARTLTITGGLTVSSSGKIDFASSAATASGIINIGGNFSYTSSTSSTTSGTVPNGTLVFNGSGTILSPQTFSLTTTTVLNYTNITIETGTVVLFNSGVVLRRETVANATYQGTLIVKGTISLAAASTITPGINATTSGTFANFTLNSGATLITANTGGVIGSIPTSANLVRTFTADAKYEFNSITAAQSTGFNGLTINTPNLITISNTFGAVTADANVIFGNTASLVINPASILDANTRTFTFGTGGVVTVNGTIRTGNTTATGALSGSATSTIVSTNTPTLTLDAASVVEYNGIAAQFAAARTFPNLTINNSNGVTMLGDVSVTTTLALTNGALSIGGNTLTSNGVISRTSGTLNGTSSSILTLAGSGAQDLAFSTVSSLSLLNVNKTGGTATLNSGATDSLNIYSGIDFTGNAGTLNLNGKIVAFKSDATKTAYVGTLAGNFNGATNVTVERYMSARRAWRFLSTPVTGSQTINAAWQEGQTNSSTLYVNNSNTKPGYGTHITGGTPGNGFDQTQLNSASIRTWTPSAGDGWSLTPPPTATTAMTTNRGYALFVRGSRNIDMNQGTSATPDVTVLRNTGSLNIGNLSRSFGSAVANDFVLFDNPFVSPVLFTALTNSGINTGFLYMWDPYLGTTGGFQTINAGNGVASPGVGSYTNASTNLIIQSGQAFMVKATASNPQLNFLESAKRTNQVLVSRDNGAAASAVVPGLSVNLRQVTNDTTVITLDGASAYFGKHFSAAIDERDANKISNYNENLGLLRNGKDLAIETRPVITTTDTLYPHLYNIKIQGYQFEVIPSGLKRAPFTAVLEDAYLNTSTPVSLKVNTIIPFTIDVNPLSYAVNRFRIVFNAAVAIAGETGNTDITAAENSGSKGVSVYPNPVTGNDIKVAFSNQPAGKYSITLYALSGRKVFTQVVNHAGGSSLIPVKMASKPSAGVYQLQVSDSKTKQVVKIVIQ